jgi:hypothetical protein
VDKGTNQPNRFLDPKSSESALPRGSNGGRDDHVQMQYYRAMAAHWNSPQNNPASALTGASMVDMSRAFAWAWDARPFPAFPARSDVWSDGENYRAGHWLNGRASSQSLGDTLREICAEAGVEADVSRIHGTVRGFGVTDSASPRSVIQSLGIVHAFDAIEADGGLSFRKRRADRPLVLAPDRLVQAEQMQAALEWTRGSDADALGRVRLGYVEDQTAYEVAVAESGVPGGGNGTATQADVAILLQSGEARAVAARWLAEVGVAQDSVRFGVPPSALALAVGDTVAIGNERFRVDRIERAGAAIVEAVRVEREVYDLIDAEDGRRPGLTYDPPSPVLPVFLDLPLLTGDEVAHAPHLAVAAAPWPGPVGVWSSGAEDGFGLNRLVEEASLVGVTQGVLLPAVAGVLDRGAALRVRLIDGVLSSAGWADILSGANLAAIGDGSSGRWEVFQFAEAVLVAPDTYDLSLRLRGQFGTEGFGAEPWPAGSLFVLLDGGPVQLDLPSAFRGIERNYRVGIAAEGPSGEDVVAQRLAFDGAGLRPYSVCHLRGRKAQNGDLMVGWIRRTRVDGDSWQSVEVPLGEESERYVVRILAGAQVLRQVEVTQAGWSYPAALQAVDLAAGATQLAVAQVSAQFGYGPFRMIELFP